MLIRFGEPADSSSRDLFAALKELYLAAGAPSVRAIADRTRGLSRDTVHRALTGDKPPKWSTLHDIVVALGGDAEQFRPLWTVAAGSIRGRYGVGLKVDMNAMQNVAKSTAPDHAVEPRETARSGAVRVAIVDDHDVVRRGLRQLLEGAGFEIAGEAADAPEAVSMVLDARPDAVIMDVRLPHGNGIDATAEILAQRPETRVLILTSYSDDEVVRGATSVGAAGFMLKQSTADELIQAVQDVAAGKTYWAHPKAAQFLADPANRTRPSQSPPGLTSLTPREREVLALVCEGLNDREIAQSLSISVSTTSSFIARIMRKLGTTSRVKTVLYAIKHGLIAGPI